MEKVTNILTRKHPHFNTISPLCTVSDALHRMCCENVDHLIVLDGDDYRGVLSEHDITVKLMYFSKPLNKIYVQDIMNTGLPVASNEDTLERCMLLMKQFSVRYLPVFDGLIFKGIISSDDIIEEAVFNRTDIFDPQREEPSLFA